MEKLTKEIFHVNITDKPKRSCLCLHSNSTENTASTPTTSPYTINELEKNFAHFLDGEKALQWWHRVVARQHGEYYVQGWNKQRIYPDFVAMTKEVEGMTRVLIFETKGQHLEGNRDTEYKRKVLKTLEKAFNATSDMKMREVPTQTGIFQLVFNAQEFSEISAQLNEGRYSTES